MKDKPTIKEKIYFPTGSDLLDIQVGGGIAYGYPAGRIINLVGDKSTGKTFLACEIVAASYYKYKDKLRWVYDDCESGFSFDTKKLYGFEIMPKDETKRVKSKRVETAFCNIRLFLESLKDEQYGIYIIDSLDALTDKEGENLANDQFNKFKKRKQNPDEKEDKEKGSYRMAKPKYLSNTFFPGLADLIEKKNALLIIISQVRCNLDPMSFEKYTRAGGKAMDFYAHTVEWLANTGDIIKNNIAIGYTVKAKNAKSKTPRPRRIVYNKILYDYGIDNVQSNIDYLFDFLTPGGKLVKNPRGKWSNKELNLEGIKQFLIENKLEDTYRKTVNPKLKVSEVADWLNNNKDETIQKKYVADFSDEMTRNELVAFVRNSKLEKILKEKVKEKWETIEESVKSKIPPKYSAD